MEKILIWMSLITFFSSANGVPPLRKMIRIPLPSSTISLDPTAVQDDSSLWVSRQVNCQLIE